ncbi:MAG TPA: UDP-N-acetylmuramate dehydrogenase [Pontimonas sp.]|nr:UDP-N-acetylmuramate dehydrogenase [Pontimonas sp.]
MTSFADLTTMRVGGPMGHYHSFSSTRSLIAGARKVWAESDDWMALGSGSNLVVSDAGFDGHVLHIQTRGVTVKKATGKRVQIHAEAGEDWDDFVSHTLAQGVRGLETLSGIPGTIGASVIQNIGAYGAEISDTLVSIDFLEFPSGTRRTVVADELELGLRTSSLKTGKLQGIVLGVTFSLEPADDGQSIPILYDQLADALGVVSGDRAPVARARETVRAIRSSKGMLVDENDPDSVSSGSFFVNPIVSEKISMALPSEAPRWFVGDQPEDVVVALGSEPTGEPSFAEPGMVKVSAAWLIEHSGVHKGFALPGSRAAISGKHSLAITNRGGASAAEIAELARYIITTVGNKTGIYLVPEPTLVGLEL